MSAVIQPSLSVSQNFLKDPRLVASLIERSSIGPQDVVYEIGPGKGIITAELARRCKRVIAIEKDPALAAFLHEKLAHLRNLTIRTADFLSCPLPPLPYKVFSNIPFNITAAIMTHLTESAHPSEDSYLVMQKEAAEMYLGQPYASLRSVLLQPWFKLEILHQFRRSDFSPQPGVDVVLLRLSKRKQPPLTRSDRQRFRDFVVYGFTAWRPSLRETLQDVFSYKQLKHISRDLRIDLVRPPTAFCCQDWLLLFEAYKELARPQAIHTIAGSEKRLQRQQEKLHKVHRTRRR